MAAAPHFNYRTERIRAPHFLKRESFERFAHGRLPLAQVEFDHDANLGVESGG
jgi:hypothetical protein